MIVGQGLAGTLLALHLLDRGKSVLVIDDGHKHAASKVAAGLINPITGRRHALCWRFPEFWNYLDYYDQLARRFGVTFFNRKPMLRFLKTEEERALFEKKWMVGDFRGIDLEFFSQPEPIPGGKLTESSYRLHQTGYVDQALLIEKVRTFLLSKGSLVEENWSEAEFQREPDRVQWKQFSADWIVFTQGYQSVSNPFFKDLPFRNAKGEILNLIGPDLKNLPILNRGKWLLPLGGGLYRAGATYDLEHIDQQVTEAGTDEILAGVKEMVDWDFTVSDRKAGVRPALHDFKPVMGRHPWFSELVIFNGLGSKGSLMAPLLAKELVDHLVDGKPLHPEADVGRFRKYL